MANTPKRTMRSSSGVDNQGEELLKMEERKKEEWQAMKKQRDEGKNAAEEAAKAVRDKDTKRKAATVMEIDEEESAEEIRKLADELELVEKAALEAKLAEEIAAAAAEAREAVKKEATDFKKAAEQDAGETAAYFKAQEVKKKAMDAAEMDDDVEMGGTTTLGEATMRFS